LKEQYQQVFLIFINKKKDILNFTSGHGLGTNSLYSGKKRVPAA
jgi:hypothetical protein